MEGSLEGGCLSGPDGPRADGETTQAWEGLLSRLQKTLEVLSPQELRKFRSVLQKVDEEPRVTPLKLELEGGSIGGLARLLAKHYHPWAASRVIVKILRQLPRTDLLPLWQSDPADGQGELGGPGPRWSSRGAPARGFPSGSPGAPSRPDQRLERGGRVSEPGECEHRGTNCTCGGWGGVGWGKGWGRGWGDGGVGSGGAWAG